MKVLGLLNNKLCILREGARVILEVNINPNDLKDILYWEELPIFNNWAEVEAEAYGSN